MQEIIRAAILIIIIFCAEKGSLEHWENLFLLQPCLMKTLMMRISTPGAPGLSCVLTSDLCERLKGQKEKKKKGKGECVSSATVKSVKALRWGKGDVWMGKFIPVFPGKHRYSAYSANGSYYRLFFNTVTLIIICLVTASEKKLGKKRRQIIRKHIRDRILEHMAKTRTGRETSLNLSGKRNRRWLR